MRLWFIVLCLSCAPAASWGQAQLVIEHPKHRQLISYNDGDFIRLTGPSGKIQGRLILQSDSAIWVRTESELIFAHDRTLRIYRERLLLREVVAIERSSPMRWQRFQRLYSGVAMAAGGMIILGSTFNALATDRVPQVSTLALTGVVLTSGLLIRFGSQHQYRTDKGWNIRIERP
jgi:hypothetical protein